MKDLILAEGALSSQEEIRNREQCNLRLPEDRGRPQSIFQHIAGEACLSGQVRTLPTASPRREPKAGRTQPEYLLRLLDRPSKKQSLDLEQGCLCLTLTFTS